MELSADAVSEFAPRGGAVVYGRHFCTLCTLPRYGHGRRHRQVRRLLYHRRRQLAHLRQSELLAAAGGRLVCAGRFAYRSRRDVQQQRCRRARAYPHDGRPRRVLGEHRPAAHDRKGGERIRNGLCGGRSRDDAVRSRRFSAEERGWQVFGRKRDKRRNAQLYV